MPEHFSHSQITSWLRCGKSYQLSRLIGAPEKPAVYLVTGNAMHTVIEDINRRFFVEQQDRRVSLECKIPPAKVAE